VKRVTQGRGSKRGRLRERARRPIGRDAPEAAREGGWPMPLQVERLDGLEDRLGRCGRSCLAEPRRELGGVGAGEVAAVLPSPPQAGSTSRQTDAAAIRQRRTCRKTNVAKLRGLFII